MAYTDTIERLSKIVDHLAPLGQMSKGAPLRSDDWNTLVSAVHDLAQVAIFRERGGEASQEGKFAPAEHDHVGQVDPSWFDPATRSLVEQRGGAPETAAELKRLSDGMAELRKTVIALQAQVKALQLRMDALDDGGRERDGRLGRLELRVEATHDLRGEVTKMDARYAALGEKLAQALALRDQLFDHAGMPIDLREIVRQMASLEELRESLKGPDGQLARYRDFDARLGALEETFNAGDGLDGIISERLRSSGLLEDLSGGMREMVKEETAPALDSMGGKLSAIERGLADVGVQVGKHESSLTQISGRVSVTETQLGRVGALETKVNDLGVRTNSVEAVTLQQGSALQGLKDVPQQLAGLQSRLTRLEPLGDSVLALEQRVASVDTRLSAMSGLDGRVKVLEELPGQLAATSERVRTLETGLSAVKTDFSALAASTGALGSRLTSVEGLSSQLATTSQRVGTLEAQLKNVTADISASSASVSSQLAATNQRIGTLEGQVSVATTDIGKLQTLTSGVSSRLQSVEGLSDQLRTATQRLGAVETMVTSTRSDLSKVESQLSRLEGTRASTSPIGLPR